MIDVVALSAVANGQGSPVAALQVPEVSSQAMQTLSSLTQGGLSPDEISNLSAAVAQVESGVKSAELRDTLLSQIKGLGMYFRNADTNGFPRWPLMTALRAYGLNLSGKSGQTEAAVAAQVQQNMNAMAHHRGTTLGAALAAATAAHVVGPIVAQHTPKAPAPKVEADTPAAPASAVDKLV